MNRCRLVPAIGTSCGLAAVGGATGASRAQVERAILRAAQEDGESPTHLNDTNFRHQARALELLGYGLFDLQGNSIKASTIQPWKMTSGQFGSLPLIKQFVQANKCADVLLCEAFRPGNPDQGHTFVVDREWFFDCNTGGLIVLANGIPGSLNGFRVVRAIALRPCQAHASSFSFRKIFTFIGSCVTRTLRRP